MYYETALGEKFNSPRGILVKDEDMYDWIIAQGDTPCAMSVYTYRDSDVEIMNEETPANWFNQYSIPWVPIDIDNHIDNSDEQILLNLRFIITKLESAGLNEHNYKIYFSGRGFHLLIHKDCFGFEDGIENLPYIVKQSVTNMATKLGFINLIDEAVYMRTALLRCPYSLNPKVNLYKIPVSRDEVMYENLNFIRFLAQTQRLDYNWLDYYNGNKQLASYVVTEIPKIPIFTTYNEPINNYACIYKMFNQGPIEGTRNNTILVLASHLMRMGIPSDLAKQLMLIWNNNSLKEQMVIERVEQVYKKKYKYGCKNKLMRQNCSTRCIHYQKHKLYDEAPSIDDIINLAKQRDFIKELKEGIDLGRTVGAPDFIVTRGEILTLIGVTKAGKSTLMKNFILGVDFRNNDNFIERNRRRTLYYTAEQSADYFILVCAQILEGCTRGYAFEHKNELLDKWYHVLSNIMPIDIMPDMKELREQINTYNPELIVLDTLDHFCDNPYNEHLGIKQTMIELQKITAETGVIVYIVSQPRRLDSIENDIKLFSGKGSGSIENQSRKVLGLSAPNENGIRKFLFLANSYGSLPNHTYNIVMQDNMRFKLVGEE